MDKLKRYDIELGDDGFWNNCLVVDESYNGDWVRYSEVRDEIEKLESEKVELLKTLNDAREFVQYYAEAGFPDAIELDKQILGIIVSKSKGQQ
jgi:hypothetical protein